MARPARPIGHHGIIGDLETAALVARDGTIDYLCWPSLDSPTIFADLLHAREGGAFVITPELTDPRTSQLYIPDTNILITRFMAEDGSAEILDMMPFPGSRPHPDNTEQCLIRKVTATRGSIHFTALCRPKFNYARVVPTVTTQGEAMSFEGGGLALTAAGASTAGLFGTSLRRTCLPCPHGCGLLAFPWKYAPSPRLVLTTPQCWTSRC